MSRTSGGIQQGQDRQYRRAIPKDPGLGSFLHQLKDDRTQYHSVLLNSPALAEEDQVHLPTSLLFLSANCICYSTSPPDRAVPQPSHTRFPLSTHIYIPPSATTTGFTPLSSSLLLVLFAPLHVDGRLPRQPFTHLDFLGPLLFPSRHFNHSSSTIIGFPPSSTSFSVRTPSFPPLYDPFFPVFSKHPEFLLGVCKMLSATL